MNTLSLSHLQRLIRPLRKGLAHGTVAPLLSVLFGLWLLGLPAGAQTRPDPARPDILWVHGRHSRIIDALVFSPDKTLVATSGGDRTIKIRRVADNALLHTLYFGRVGNRKSDE